jgi:hypothetical protein
MDKTLASRTGFPGLSAISYLLLGALVLGGLAYWLPWIDHRAAALKLSGQDLGEFNKFVPALQGESLGALRNVLYLPPLASAACLALLVANRRISYPKYVRMSALALALFLLSGLLPPVWGRPRDLFAPQYRLQSTAAMFGASLVLAHGLFRRVQLVSLAWVTAVLSVLALLPTVCAFWIAWPAIWTAYDSPSIHLGWGLALHMMSWVSTLVLAVLMLCLTRAQRHRIPGARGEPGGT